MKETESLFFELIRVAIGYADSLSLTPSNKEWRTLYDIAKKQSLLGVCFAAVQRLGADVDNVSGRIGMSEMLYLTWMGMAAKIQQRNGIVTKRCAEVQRMLFASGLRCCILKGQGVAQVYPKHIRGLRQSGDIDVYSDCAIELSQTDKAVLQEKGKNGRAYYDEHFTKDKCLRKLDEIMEL